MTIMSHHDLATAFGIMGNVVSFMVYLAPLPTFYRICKKKSTEGFQSIPYAVALFSAMLMLYYAFLKTNVVMLITINSIGCFIETAYLILYLIYADRAARIYTGKLLVFFNIGLYGAIVVSTFFIHSSPLRVTAVGWICAVFSVCVFAAPLSIMRLVIRTKSVEFMPISLSFFLTLCAVMWFFYGLLIVDYFVALPNVLGFTFGIVQMLLYAVYRNGKKKVLPEVQIIQGFPNGLIIELPQDEKSKNVAAGAELSYQDDEKPNNNNHEGRNNNAAENTVVITVVEAVPSSNVSNVV